MIALLLAVTIARPLDWSQWRTPDSVTRCEQEVMEAYDRALGLRSVDCDDGYHAARCVGDNATTIAACWQGVLAARTACYQQARDEARGRSDAVRVRCMPTPTVTPVIPTESPDLTRAPDIGHPPAH